MVAKGSKISEESRERYRAAALRRKSQLVRLSIVSEDEYNKAVADGLKWCNRCKIFKSPDAFTKRQSRCRECSARIFQNYYAENNEKLLVQRKKYYQDNHAEQLRYNKKRSFESYGASFEWYEQKLAEQGGKCAICRSEVPGGQGRFHIDHNHACHSKPKTACDRCRRGLLCSTCNISIARFESDPGWADRALEYLYGYPLDGNRT